MSFLRDIDIDPSAVIALVEEQPALWDRTLDRYKDRDTAKKIWWEIVAQIDSQFDSRPPTEQRELVHEVKKKWINVRDSWIKNYKMNLKNKGLKRKRKYIYHNQLQFLSKVVDLNDSSSCVDLQGDNNSMNSGEEQSANEGVQHLSQPIIMEPEKELVRQPPKKGIKKESTEPNYIHKKMEDTNKRLGIKNESTEPNYIHKKMEDINLRLSVDIDRDSRIEDPRLLFFKGILPSIKHFSNDQFIDFQIGVLQLIKSVNAQTSTS